MIPNQASLDTAATIQKPDSKSDLAAIVGPENVHTAEATMHVAPASVAELSAILVYANQHRIAVSPRGAGTRLGWGKPVNAPIVLHTSRLNALREHIWQDMTCTVEAGATWSSLQSALARHNQFVALDPLWPETATVGGIIATNDSGALRLKYGSLRDLILGMTIVLADGTIAKTGGKVVKNVAGYDLHKLMTGAFGTLGVLAEVTFRLHATPADIRSFTLSSTAVEPLGVLLLELTASQLSLHALQLRALTGSFALDVALATLPSVLSVQTAQLEAIAARHSLTVARANESVWAAREAVFATAAFVAKITMLPTDIARFSALVQQLGGTAVTQATGIMTAALPSADAIGRLRQEAEVAKGHLTILQQAAGSALPAWGPPPDTLPLMQQIKQRFDPHGILNPDVYLDGI